MTDRAPYNRRLFCNQYPIFQ